MLKCGGVNRYYLPPPPQPREKWREKCREKEREKGGRGRKREEILQGSTVIYEEAASNTCGGGVGVVWDFLLQ